MSYKNLLQALQDGKMSLEEAKNGFRTASSRLNPRVRKEQEISGSAPTTMSIDSLVDELSGSLAKALYIDDAGFLEPDQSFVDLGLDSILGVEWINAINKRFGLKIAATKVYDYPNLETFASFVQAELKENEGVLPPVETYEFPIEAPAVERNGSASEASASPERVEQQGSKTDRIAIVGMSGRYPGASNLKEFWENLKEARNSVREVPSERWDVDEHYDPDPSQTGKSYCKWLGALDDVDCFDPDFFMIPPAEAELMDPQHRIFLEEAYKAFEDSGYGPKALSDLKCGVYMGLMMNEYVYMVPAQEENGLNTGSSASIAAARIPYFLNLKGPALPIDTACSSSLVATHLACQALRHQEIDMALVGGATLYLTAESFKAMCSAGMLSSDGQCKSFDDEANGFVPGEGAGILVLKRLEDAERDGDSIYGVIIGSGINQDGRTNGITAPSVTSQIALEREVYDRFGIHPDTIDYVEAHGTGTKLGDPIELEALNTVFREYTERQHFCGLGSVKSNIGHTSAAAGVAGVHKVLLSLQHGQMVPSLNFSKANQHCEFEDSPFYVNTELKPWSRRNTKLRRAAVSSFGYSGTNAHVVIEEYPGDETPIFSETERQPLPLIFAARDEERLMEVAQNSLSYLEGLADDSSFSLRNMAYTLQVGREAMAERMALVVDSREDAIAKLRSFVRGETSPASQIYRGRVPRKRGRLVSFQLEPTMASQVVRDFGEGDYELLLKQWVVGLDYDWKQLHAGHKVKRVSLPTYPFARERYWAPKPTGKAASTTKKGSDDRAIELKPRSVEITPKRALQLELSRIVLSEPDLAVVGSAPERKAPLIRLQMPDKVASESKRQRAALIGTEELSNGVLVLKIPGDLSSDLLDDLKDCFQEINSRSDIRSVILEGGETIFLTGGAAERAAFFEQEVARVILECPVPLIGAMKGKCLGAGWLIAGLCDLLVCSKESHYLFRDSDGAWEPSEVEKAFFGKRFGQRIGNDLLQGAIPFPGMAFRRKGASFEVVSQRDVLSRAREMAQEIVTSPREALVLLKRHLSEEIRRLGQRLVTSGLSEVSLDQSEDVLESESLELGVARTDYGKKCRSQSVDLKSEVVSLESFSNGVLLITIRDEENKNGFSPALAQGLQDAFDYVRGSEEYKVLVLTGYGNYFSCGGTREALLAIQEGSAQFTDSKVSSLPLECDLPVVAAMQGHGIGAGFALGMFADYVVLSEESIFHSPYMNYGFTPGAGATLVIPSRLGQDLGWETLLTAREYKGRELKERGIRMPVLPREDVLPRALAMAHELATSSRELLVKDKALRASWLRFQLETFYTREVEMHGKTFVGNEEVKEKIQQRFTNSLSSKLGRSDRRTSDEGGFLKAVTEVLQETLSDELHLPIERVALDVAFIEMGLDSINSVTWVRSLNQRLELNIEAAEVYNFPTILEFSSHVSELLKEKGKTDFFEETMTGVEKVAHTQAQVVIQKAAKPQTLIEDIAVIGVAGQFPAAKNVEEFWSNIVQGRDCISEVPADRWSLEDYFDPDPDAPGKTYSKWMGVVEDVDKFDPLFFNISPLEAEAMDPQQRMALETAWKCLEDAGYAPSRLAKQKCGVFVGCAVSDYGFGLDEQEMDGAALVGGSMSILPARISYLLNLQGPCVALDTACSSSLVAIASACDSLVLGSSDVALAGGVSVMAGPSMHLMTSKAGMLSADGKCYTFDQRANGFVAGEGVGMILLKRLSDAEKDGDQIYGVIRGWGTNQDGKTNGITAPNGDSQSSLQREIYQRFDLRLENIQLVEAHGTGTKLGDPIEVKALKDSFGDHQEREATCALGSVKGNIGHLLHAAGVAGVIKILLALKHHQLPPTINFENLNEHIQLDGSPFYVNTECQDWYVKSGAKRGAVVNSFGFSGTNAHAVIEEYQGVKKAAASSSNATKVIVLSARSRERLGKVASDLVEFLRGRGSEGWNLDEIAYTLQVGRSALENRLGLLVDSVEDLLKKLQHFIDGEEDSALRQGRIKRGEVWFPSSEEKEELDRFVTERHFDELLAAWVSGKDIEWEKLYPEGCPGRISLPTYPFRRDRYWKGEGSSKVTTQSEEVIAPQRGVTKCLRPVWIPSRPLDEGETPETFSRWIVFPVGLDSRWVDQLKMNCEAAEIISEAPSGSGVGEQFENTAHRLFELVREQLQSHGDQPCLVQVLCKTPGAGGLNSGLVGLLRSARMENSNLLGQVIEVDLEEALEDKLAEGAARSEEIHIRYDAGQRILPGLEEVSTIDGESWKGEVPWRDGGVYLITGGFGGLGKIFAKEISKRCNDFTIILTGRSPEGEEHREFLEELRGYNGIATYRKVDVSEATDVASLIEEIREDFGQLNGVLHAAGINRENFAIRKANEEFGRVLSPKVRGAVNLDRSTHDVDLDFFFLFSSLSGVNGNVGQVDYACANAFMDAYARYRAELVEAGRRRGRTLTINWPLWEEGGMIVDEATEAALLSLGVVPMSSNDGLNVFYQAMIGDSSQVIVTSEVGTSGEVQILVDITEDVDSKELRQKTLRQLKQLLAETMKLPLDQLESDESFETYGIDSVLVTRLNQRLGEVFTDLPRTILFEVQNLEGLTDYCLDHSRSACIRWSGLLAREAVSEPVRSDRNRIPIKEAASTEILQEPIAIIGITGRYSAAENLHEFWENLKAAKNCVTEIPAERWPLDGFFESDPKEAVAKGKSYSKWGSFLDGFAEFDPLFFNISPREAISMDPQERLFLQSAWEVLESAGYTREKISRECGGRVGVFAGITKLGFERYREDWKRQGVEADPYTSFSSVANRVSYLFNLKGPSLPIDTMCSSSLSAIHEACEHLRLSRCEMAIAGGVNLHLHPSSYASLCQMHMLSKGGQCRSFGEGGDGFVPGEGVGAVLLKPLSAAWRDGDPIHAVIRATSVNHGGKTNGFTVPSPLAQRDLIRDAIENSGLSAEDISYVEAHGTGTELGDPIEVRGLTEAFGEETSKKGFCALGSVKSNLGHLEAAAGIAGLSKIVLQMKHGQLAPSLHAQDLNPNIDFEKSPFRVQRELSDWNRPVAEEEGELREKSRVAAISSFGAGGANAHLILEEPPVAEESRSPQESVVILSARTEESLVAYAKKLADFLVTERSVNLANLAYTLQVGREAMEERFAGSVNSVEELQDKLSQFVGGCCPDGFVRSRVSSSERRSLAVFADDEDMTTTLEAWYRKRKFGNLLELWGKGMSIDWEKLYGEAKPKRIPLPTYAFAKERYWVDIDWSARVRETKGSILHPLLHENRTSLSELRFQSHFCGDEFFLTDHVISGRKIFPGVAYLEMAWTAAEQLFRSSIDHSFSVSLSHVGWVRPLLVSAEGQSLLLRFKKESDQSLSFQAYTEFDEEKVVHCQGNASVDALEISPKVELNQLRSRVGAFQLSANDCYRIFSQMGIFYGPAHRSIERIWTGNGEVLARLKLPDTVSSSRGDYHLHPSLMDGAFQASLGLSADWEGLAGEETASAVVPFSIACLKSFGECSGSVWAWIRPSAVAARDDSWVVDIDLCGEDGSVSVQMKEVTFRRLDDRSEAPKTLLAHPVWRDEPASPQQLGVVGEHRMILVEMAETPTLARKLEGIGVSEVCCLSASGRSLGERFNEVAQQVFEEVREVLSKRPATALILQLVISAGGEESFAGGLAALLRTARRENPALKTQLIEVDGGEDALAQILVSYGRDLTDDWVRYEGGRRIVREWEELPEVDQLNPPSWREGGVYLISGGAGGLGTLFAGEIASQLTRGTLVLVGRAKSESIQKQEIEQLERAGVEVIYRQADVSRWSEVERLIGELLAQFRRIDGVIHCAGLIKDNFIIKKETSEFLEVLASKVSGVVNLDRATKDQDLDLFLLFSSGAAIIGNPGQADYAAANAFLDGFANDRNREVERGTRRGRTLSINWPYWREGGMELDESSLGLMKSELGMFSIECDAGLSAFQQAMESSESQVLVMAGEKDRLRRLLRKEREVQPTMLEATLGGEEQESLQELACEYFRESLSSSLNIPKQRIRADEPMSDLGIESIVAINLINAWEKDFGSLPKTLLFEYQTLQSLAGYFVQSHPSKLRTVLGLEIAQAKTVHHSTVNKAPDREMARVQEPGVGSDDIAIIGVSGRYPQADNLREFWENLRDARDCISEVPPHRWRWQDYFSDEAKLHLSKWGGFISGVDQFDAKFFGISPRLAPYIDPQERLFLEESWKALEDAGYQRKDFYAKGSDFARSQVGVYAGVMYGEYQLYGPEMTQAGIPAAFAGNPASIANRVSYVFNLHGPSMTIDTMCSSSLTGIHLACQDLKLGRTHLAIAGGVNLSIHPNKYTMLSAGQFISTKGRCESFGEGGDGYIPSEGVGVVILKRLADAERDRDQIYGVIKGSAVNHGGRTSGYSVPNPAAQQWVIEQAVKEARIDPKNISYIEAHGTGTKLGDPIEILGLNKAIGEYAREGHCWMGSVKSNIGHAEAAAGVAGLTKVLLQMKHGQIVPSLHSERRNPHIDFDKSVFEVNQTLRDWERLQLDGKSVPRIAGVSSFGAGGSNAHLLVQEYQTRVERKDRSSKKSMTAQSEAIILSARETEQLLEVARNLFSYLEQVDEKADDLLPEISFTLQVGREAMEVRAGIVVMTVNELKEALRDFISGRSSAEFVVGEVEESSLVSKSELERATTRRDLVSLVRHWVGGADVDWSRLRGQQKPGRISLPTYPFLRERYWVEIPKAEVSASISVSKAEPVFTGKAPPRSLQALRKVAEFSSAPLEKPRGLLLEPLGEERMSEVEKVTWVEPEPQENKAKSGGDLHFDQLKSELCQSLSKALLVDEVDLKWKKPFVALGLDSIVGVEWINELNEQYGIEVKAELIYEHPNLEEFSLALWQVIEDGKMLPETGATVDVENKGEALETDVERLCQELQTSLAEALFLEPIDVKLDKSFVDLGLDSIVGVEWIAKVNERYGLTVEAASIYEYPTLRQYAGFLQSELGSGARSVADEAVLPIKSQDVPVAILSSTSRQQRQTDIAIIGMSGQFPGGKTLDEFWSLLSEGRHAFTELPQNRGWNLDDFPQTYVQRGAFLDGVDEFDPLFFQISPKEAMTMDPTERLFLEESWRAIEDAGFLPEKIAGSPWGVFCGNGGDYTLLLREVTGFSPHVTLCQVPARVSHYLDLTGPCQSVDAACGSALLAVAQACDALVAGKCDVALAGGVFVHSTPNLLVSASQVELLTRSDQSCALDVRSKGMTSGEAAGVVLLKPLAQALEDGDRIHGVIEGWANNHNGRTSSMASANAGSLEQLFAGIYEKFQIDPASITMLEANASGLPTADAAEVYALTKAFRGETSKKQFCALGTVENNVGHAFHASGMSHLFKVLLSLKHQAIPGTLNVRKLDESLAIEESPFFVNQQSIAWNVDKEQQRRAGVSSFGATGTNVHIVVSESPQRSCEKSRSQIREGLEELIVLSARNTSSLQRACRNLARFLEDPSSGNLALSNLSINLMMRRSHFEESCALVVSNFHDLQNELEKVANGVQPLNGFVGCAVDKSQLGPSFSLIAKEKIQALQKKRNSRKEDLMVLADLYVKGVSLDLASLFSDEEKLLLELPSYPFEKRSCWIQPALNRSLQKKGSPDFGIVTSDEEAIVKFLEELIDLPKNWGGLDQSLSDLGLDSLLEMRFLNRINANYEVEFDASLLVGRSLREIADQVSKKSKAVVTDYKESREGEEWPLPSFIERGDIRVAPCISGIKGSMGEQDLRNLMKLGVACWKEDKRLVFEWFEKNHTMESLRETLAEPEALYKLLDDGKRYYPASEMQQFALYESEINQRPTFNIGQGFWLEMPVKLDLLNQALADLMSQHAIFRTGVRQLDDQWIQVVDNRVKITCQEFCWSETSQGQTFQEWVIAFQRGKNEVLFDIERGQLFDAYLLHNGLDKSVFFFHSHHFHIDGFTLFLFQQEVFLRYEALLQGKVFSSIRSRAEYGHYALSQFDPKRKEATTYWKQRLQGRRSTAILRDQECYLESSATRAGGFELEISKELLRDCESFQRKTGATLTQLLTCSLAILSFRLSGQILPLQMVYNVRDRLEFETVMGDFSSSLPMILEMTVKNTVREVLSAYQESMLEIQQYRHFNFFELLRELGDESGLLGGISIDSTDRDTLGEATSFAERLLAIPMDERLPVAPLLVCLVKMQGKVSLPIMYDRRFFSAKTIDLLVENLLIVLKEILKTPEIKIAEITINSALKKRLYLDGKVG